MGMHDKHLAVKIRDVQGELRTEFVNAVSQESAPASVPESVPEPEIIPQLELEEGGS